MMKIPDGWEAGWRAWKAMNESLVTASGLDELESGLAGPAWAHHRLPERPERYRERTATWDPGNGVLDEDERGRW